MGKFCYMFFPELFAFILAKSLGGVPMTGFTVMLVLFSVLKKKLSEDGTDPMMMRVLILSTMFLTEIGAAVSISAGCTDLSKHAILLTISAATSLVVFRSLRASEKHFLNMGRLNWILCAADPTVLVLFRVFAKNKNNTFNWITVGSMSIQASALIELLLCFTFACNAFCISRHKCETLLPFYISGALCCILMKLLLKESGMAIIVAIGVLLISFLHVGSSWHLTRPLLSVSNVKMLLCNAILPFAVLMAVFVVIASVYCYSEATLKRAETEKNGAVYWDKSQYTYIVSEQSGLSQDETTHYKKVIRLFERTHAAGEQLTMAQNCVDAAPLIRFNAEYQPFHNAVVSELLGDFSFAELSRAYGKLPVIAAVLLFAAGAAGCLFLLSKRRSLAAFAGKAGMIWLLLHLVFHVFGFRGFLPFTGLPLPFASYGGSFFIFFVNMVSVAVYALMCPETLTSDETE